MKVLVRHDAFDALVARIRRRVRTGEHTGRIEDVEALVLHRAHVEIIHRHDMEHIEIVLATKAFLVPAHGTLE
jgi:hypothetical protein